ncbi:IQ domain-containing protein E-like isoform X2 [Dysidea avara]|uniref:IQ domain-containing protein E-like isoform X2 n=1 Tax=Dysidea avara TaxID=196820 RepID=UPI003324AF75
MEAHSLSSHSVVSDASASEISALGVFMPKPPDGPKPARKDTKRRSRIASSPYLATSTKQPQQRKESVKDSSAKLGSNGTWKSFGDVVRAATTQQAVTSAFLKSLHKSKSTEGIETNRRKRRLHSSEMTLGGPAAEYSKSCEDMYDEIVELKRSLNIVTSERDIARSKLVQLEKLLVKRDKQVEDMLASGYVGNHEVTRTLAGGKKIDTTVLSSLKQKIHLLERNLREKEATINKLSANLKVSRVEEAELTAETYYYEVCRLKEILRHQNSKVEEMLSLSTAGDVMSRLAVLNAAVIKLLEQKKALQSDKKLLQEKLKHSVARIEHSETGIRAPIADQYADQQRAEMLSRIVDLELAMREKENTITSLCNEFEENKKQYEERINGLATNLDESNSQSTTVQFQLAEAEKSKQKLKNHLKQLKTDKNYYREQEKSKSQEAEEARAALHTHSTSIQQLQEQLKQTQEQLSNEEKAREHARTLQRKKPHMFASSRAQRHEAAAVIQERWKRSQSIRKQQRYDEDFNEGVSLVQSAIRAHLSQRKFLQDGVDMSQSEAATEDSDDEAVNVIQAAVRGHLTRQTHTDTLNSNPLELSDEEAQSRDEDQQISSMWRTDNILVPTHTTEIVNAEHSREDQMKNRKRINRLDMQVTSSSAQTKSKY